MEAGELTGETEGNEVYGYAKEILKHLPPIALTKDGRIREWLEEYEEMERGHRHISHLFGLYPGDRIHTGEEALCKAAKKTLAARLANGRRSYRLEQGMAGMYVCKTLGEGDCGRKPAAFPGKKLKGQSL